MSRNTSMLDFALFYAGKGWRVFPCHTWTDKGACSCADPACQNPAKHPRYKAQVIEHGVTDATADVKKVRELWGIWPDANIGIATGKQSGLVVLDIDPEHGGEDSLLALVSEHERLPDTPESLTGGGGRHVLFAYPEGATIRNSAGKLGPGLDIRGEGGYIVAPPSRHKSGKCYEWEPMSKPSQTPLANLPDWMVKALNEPAQSTNGNGHKPAAELPEHIRDGNRNGTLTSLAGTMRRRGMTGDEIYAALWTVNQERCDPPLSADEVMVISKSVNRYAPTDPPVYRDAPKIERREPLNAHEAGLAFTDLLNHLHGRTIKTGIVTLDNAIGGLERQTLTILAARPSMGKSTLAWQIARNVVTQGMKSYFFSLEMAVTSLWAKAACGAAGVRWKDIRSETASNEEIDSVVEAAALLMDRYGERLLIDDGVNTSETIWQGIEKHRPDIVVVDHLRLVADRTDNEVQRLGAITQRLKDAAKAYNCAVLCLAQLNRSVEQKDNKRPQLSDLRDSGQIEENADLVLMMYRDDYYEPVEGAKIILSETEILVRKFRDDINHQRVKLMFDTKHQWFEDRRTVNPNTI